MAAYVTAVEHSDPQPDPRTALDAFGCTPYGYATGHRHCPPLMLQALNPATPITQLQHIAAQLVAQAGADTPTPAPFKQAPAPLTAGSQAKQQQEQEQGCLGANGK
jgi:hypothetical protein